LNRYCNRDQELARSLRYLMFSTDLVSFGLFCTTHPSIGHRGGKKKSPFDLSRVSPSHHQTSISLVFPNNSDIDNSIQPYSLVASSKASDRSSRTSIHTPRFFPRRPHSLPTVQAHPIFQGAVPNREKAPAKGGIRFDSSISQSRTCRR